MKSNNSVRTIFITAILLTGIMGFSCVSTFTGGGLGSMEFDAPVEEVFAYMTTPENEERCNPIVSIDKVEGKGLGMHVNYTVNHTNGKVVKGETLYVDYVPNQRIVTVSSGDGGVNVQRMTAIFNEPEEGKTTVTIFVEGSMAVPMASKGLYRSQLGKTKVWMEELAECAREDIENSR